MKLTKTLSLFTGAALLLCSSVALANRFADVQVNATPLKDSVYMLTGAGGNVQQYIENTRYVISKIDEQTQVIPGHGELTNKAGLQKELAMLEQSLAIVTAAKQQGMTEAELIAKGLGDEFKAWHWNFITEERWIKTLYQAVP